MSTTEGTHSYTYDNIYQLTSVDYPDGYPFPGLTYTFDSVGNRISTVNGGTTTYTTNTMNQYTDVGGTPYTYDANGNLTSDGTNTYSYDYENRLVQVVTPSDTINFTCDPLRRRISKTDSTGTTRFIYDGDQVIMETDEVGATTATYVYGIGIDEVLSMNAGGSIYYYHFDGLGSIKEIASSTGLTVEKYEYDVYGQPSIYDGSDSPLPESTSANCYMFTGRRYDKETGLYYYRARYYEPHIGRFLQKDPWTRLPNDPRLIEFYSFNNTVFVILLSFTVGKEPRNHILPLFHNYFRTVGNSVPFGRSNADLYRYCSNNPTNRIDPYGYFLLPGAVVGALVGAVAGGFGAFMGGATDIKSIAAAAAAGAAGGFVGGAFGVTTGIGAVIGAFAGAAGAAALGGNPGAIMGAALAGAIGGAIGGLPGLGLLGVVQGTWITGVWGFAYGMVGQELYEHFTENNEPLNTLSRKTGTLSTSSKKYIH